MKIRYFSDTDTALIDLSERPVHQTLPIGDYVLLDLDAQGNLVSMTIEHARAQANLPEVAFLQETGT